MPEPTASPEAPSQAAPAPSTLASALEAMLPPRRESVAGPRAAADGVPDASGANVQPTAEAGTGDPAAKAPAPDPEPSTPDTSGEPAGEQQNGKPDDAPKDGAPDGGDGDKDDQPSSRRGPWRELEETKQALAALKEQVANLSTERDQLAGTVKEREAKAQQQEAALIGYLGQDVGDDGLTEYARLLRGQKTREGLSGPEQERFAELTERLEMAKLIQDSAFGSIGGGLVDPDLGIDAETVGKAGSIENWKAQYRQALDAKVIAPLKEQHAAEIKELKAEYDGKLAEQKRSYEARLAGAPTRAPLAGGRPTAPNGAASGASLDPFAQLTQGLAAREAQHA